MEKHRLVVGWKGFIPGWRGIKKGQGMARRDEGRTDVTEILT